MNEIEFVEKMKVLEMKSGDLLVIMVKDRLSVPTYDRIRASFKAEFPEHKALILDADTDIGIIRDV